MTTTTKSSKLDKKLNAIKNTQKGKLNKNKEKGQIQSPKRPKRVPSHEVKSVPQKPK